jgi:predicted DNA-binding transcriptional regulator AlpA
MKSIRISAASALTGLAVQTIRNKVSKGEFPRPYKPSTSVAVWDEAELLTWLQATKQGDSNDRSNRKAEDI